MDGVNSGGTRGNRIECVGRETREGVGGGAV